VDHDNVSDRDLGCALAAVFTKGARLSTRFYRHDVKTRQAVYGMMKTDVVNSWIVAGFAGHGFIVTPDEQEQEAILLERRVWSSQ
jgi:hypothetical protein